MKKVYKLEDLDCANCAIAKIDGVDAVSVNFLTQRMALEADESRFEEIMERVVKACKRVEPDCRILR